MASKTTAPPWEKPAKTMRFGEIPSSSCSSRLGHAPSRIKPSGFRVVGLGFRKKITGPSGARFPNNP